MAVLWEEIVACSNVLSLSTPAGHPRPLQGRKVERAECVVHGCRGFQGHSRALLLSKGQFISYLSDSGITCIQFHDLIHENFVLLITRRRAPRKWSPHVAFPLSARIRLSVNYGMQAVVLHIF